MFIWDVNPEVLSESVMKLKFTLNLWLLLRISDSIRYFVSAYVYVVCQGFSGPLFSVISFQIALKDPMKSLEKRIFLFTVLTYFPETDWTNELLFLF